MKHMWYYSQRFQLIIEDVKADLIRATDLGIKNGGRLNSENVIMNVYITIDAQFCQHAWLLAQRFRILWNVSGLELDLADSGRHLASVKKRIQYCKTLAMLLMKRLI